MDHRPGDVGAVGPDAFDSVPANASHPCRLEVSAAGIAPFRGPRARPAACARVLLALSASALFFLAGCASKPATPPPAAPPPVAAPPPPAPPPPAPPPPVAPALPAPPPPTPAVRTPPPPPQRVVYVKVARANLREAPGTRAHITAVLTKGEKLIILEERELGPRNLWYRVKLGDGREGWVGESVTSAAPD